MSFSCQDTRNLLCEILVFDFFVVEELGSFRGIVDDFGDLLTVS